eukprot:1190503-Lingulodinium_polyedra.AAC.1
MAGRGGRFHTRPHDGGCRAVAAATLPGPWPPNTTKQRVLTTTPANPAWVGQRARLNARATSTLA